MKALTKLLVVIVIMVGLSTTVMAQNGGATASATASCTIINPIAVARTSNLSFGVLAVETTVSGKCVLSTAGARTAIGGVNIPSSGAAGKNASFVVSGEANTTYGIVLPATINIVLGTSNMVIDALSARFNGQVSDEVTSKLDASGLDSFNVGGTLNVIKAQDVGTYEGTFPVTVAYN